MALPAYSSTIYLTGTSTSMTAEAMGGSGAGPYQVTNAAKRALDPATALTFYDNGVSISASDILSIDYLFGKVTFTASKTGPITVTGAYLPLLAFADCYAADLSFAADSLDSSVFGSQWKTTMQGLKQLTGTITTRGLPGTDLDPGAGTLSVASLFTGGTSTLLDIDLGGTGSSYRSFVSIFGFDTSASVDALVDTPVNFESQAITAANGDRINIGYGS